MANKLIFSILYMTCCDLENNCQLKLDIEGFQLNIEFQLDVKYKFRALKIFDF